ncbi:P-loop containing nucleoside triphosphate hydrolase protein, partial [Pisolithus microcarpus]
MVPQPIVIAVMGPPGSGKTNFINQLTGTREGGAAHQLKSHTQTVREFTVNFKDRKYVFVDFPAFDNDYQSHCDTLRKIAEWLEEKYRQKVKLSGIIYTHRITNDGMSGPVWKNLDMFGRLCGERAAGGVWLVTTMWDKVRDRELADDRVSQLEANLWKPLIDAGARHKRFEENSSRCAWRVVEDLTGGGEPLLLQQELVDGERRLSETTVGQALYAHFQKLLQEQKETIEQLREEAKAQKDPDLMKELEAEQRRLEVELQKTRDEMEKLEIPFSRRIAHFF